MTHSAQEISVVYIKLAHGQEPQYTCDLGESSQAALLSLMHKHLKVGRANKRWIYTACPKKKLHTLCGGGGVVFGLIR